MYGEKSKLKKEKHLKEEFYRSGDLELVIIPKNSLLKWYKNVKGTNRFLNLNNEGDASFKSSYPVGA